MEWTVKSDKGVTTIDTSQLLELLLSKVAAPKVRSDHEHLASALGEYLESKAMLSTLSFRQLFSIAFTLGYFYRIFNTNNNVEVHFDTTEQPSTASTQQSTD
jgi:hypothetical protein